MLSKENMEKTILKKWQFSIKTKNSHNKYLSFLSACNKASALNSRTATATSRNNMSAPQTGTAIVAALNQTSPL